MPATASSSESETSHLKKHVATVHTAAPLSLVQRKAFSVLVFNAYPMLLQRQEHKIALPLFCDLIGFDSKNIQALEDSLNQLVQTRINWEDGEGKKRRWAATTFLASVEVRGGVCQYEFSRFLSKELYKPEIYARINVDALREFESKHGIALYENCARYRPNGSYKGGTPDWPMDLFRRLMGLEDSPYYTDFRKLNERVIKPAMIEVNARSDISLEARYKKRGRTVVSVSFGVRDRLRGLPPAESISEIHPLAAQARDRYKVPLLKSAEWLEAYGESRFAEVLRITNEMTAQGKAKSPVGFMRRALEENYMFAVDAKAARKKEREQLVEAKAAKKVEEKRVKAEAENARQQEERLAEDAIGRFEALSNDGQENILNDLSTENSFFRDRYARQGRAGLLVGTLRVILAHHLGEKWALRQ